jgi:hypothetical protein
MFEPPETPMRRLLPLLALLLASPALGEAPDCAALKSTTNAFELTIDSTSVKPGKDPVARQIRRQVERKAGETIAYDIFSPEVFLRRKFTSNGFVTENFDTNEKVRRAASYSIDTSKDYFALAEPFDFNVVMKSEDGKVYSDVHSSVSFDGTVEIELGGCPYTLTRMYQANRGTSNDKPLNNRSEVWYSPELKSSLYSRTESGDGSIFELRARDISTSFTPVE